MRASATLCVPATRSNLQLASGASAVVNLTLAALFDTASWLPAHHRRADEPDDEWKWTLRSPVSRPILRIVEDGETLEVSTSASSETPHSGTTSVRESVTSGDGGFGQGGVHNVLALHRTLDDGGDMLVRADVGSTRVPAAYAPSTGLDAGYERKMTPTAAGGTMARVVVHYAAHPEIVATGVTSGLTETSVTTAQRMSLGEQVEVEVGGRVEAVQTAQLALASHPFVRVSAHPNGAWTLEYRMATDRGLQGFEDVTTGDSDVPVAVVENGKLRLEQGRHQEGSVARQLGRGSVEFAAYHDDLVRTTLSGGGASGPAETPAGGVQGGMLVDPTTGSFKALGSGYRTSGVRISASAPLVAGVWIAAEYSDGAALMSNTGGGVDFAGSIGGLRAVGSQAATIALKGRLSATGTKVRVSYRWQPASLVTAVDPFSSFADQPFFSCRLRQPIHLGRGLPQGLDATIDVTNLLAEGYRPFLSADGQTLYFAQAPRTIQAGLSFTF